MAEAKTLEFYMANPDEMPESLSDIEASLQEPKVEEDVKQSDEPSAVEGQEEAKVEEAPQEEAKPKLLSKNGKDEIPYQVLVSERERRAAAEQAAKELRDRLAEIENRVAAVGQQQEVPKTEEGVPDIDRMTEDFPEIGKVIKTLQAQIEAANQKLGEVEQIERQRQQQEADTARSKVQEAIDGNPFLRYWQAEDPEMFGRAVDLDNVLRNDPKNSHLSMEQRFERVVKAVTAIYGEPELPDTYKPTAPQTEDMNELTEKAKEVVKKTESFKPRSLSDIPGGTPPAANESEKLQNMSPAQLASMMQDMDLDQVNALMARLG